MHFRTCHSPYSILWSVVGLVCARGSIFLKPIMRLHAAASPERHTGPVSEERREGSASGHHCALDRGASTRPNSSAIPKNYSCILIQLYDRRTWSNDIVVYAARGTRAACSGVIAVVAGTKKEASAACQPRHARSRARCRHNATTADAQS